MNENLDKDALTFFGVITASVSHELNNVLSIISEYSGLLEDLVLADDQGRPIDKERIRKIAQNIAEQINREKKIIKLLNRFAHRVDAPIMEFNLNELLGDIVRLSTRFASLKKVTLEISLPEEHITIVNNPLAVQYSIFLCLNLALEFSTAQNSIYTKLAKDNSQAIITIVTTLVGTDQDTIDKLEYIAVILKNLGGEITFMTRGLNERVFRLTIPLSQANATGKNKENYSDEHKDIIG
jgi:signal transduction histidine kinase